MMMFDDMSEVLCIPPLAIHSLRRFTSDSRDGELCVVLLSWVMSGSQKPDSGSTTSGRVLDSSATFVINSHTRKVTQSMMPFSIGVHMSKPLEGVRWIKVCPTAMRLTPSGQAIKKALCTGLETKGNRFQFVKHH